MKTRSFLLFFATFAVILCAFAVKKKRKGAKILRKERKDLLFFDAICHTPF